MNYIPKIIHYCWFGNNEKGELILKCIESWKKHLPDYEIREWNNKDLTICNNQYVKEAYQEKIWAFVSDYFRLYALYNYGGIYFDITNEVYKSLDNFLNLDFFASIENCRGTIRPLSMGVIGAKKHNLFVKELLDEYNNISIYDKDGNVEFYPNTERFKEYLYKHYDIPDKINKNEKIVLKENHIIFPSNYFCEYKNGITYVKHHYNGSWVPNLTEKERNYIFNKLYFKIYTIKKGYFWKEIQNIPEFPIFAYPRINKRSVVITIGMDKKC